MKYINLFDTQAEYDEAQKYYPNVSYIVATDEVVYQENDPGPDNSKEYLTFEALESGTFTLTVPVDVNSTKMTSVSYSIDDGANWTTTTIDNTLQTITTPTIKTGAIMVIIIIPTFFKISIAISDSSPKPLVLVTVSK